MWFISNGAKSLLFGFFFLLLHYVAIIIFASDATEPQHTDHNGYKPKGRKPDKKTDNSKPCRWI